MHRQLANRHMNVNQKLNKYMAAMAQTRPVESATVDWHCCRRLVLIPALAESAQLPATLAALAANPAAARAGTVIMVMVNNNPPVNIAQDNSSERDQWAADNQRTLTWLRRGGAGPGLDLAWIDAASPGAELPAGTGVGLARKIAADSAIAALLAARPAADLRQVLLLHLDADTLVEPNYLATVAAAFDQTASGGAVIAYAHQPGDTPEVEAAMNAYELYLRYFVQGLALAQSPYAFHTIGSAMACTAAAYIRCGGISAKRTGGEDFYFLQQLAKTGTVQMVTGTTVHPSARLSARVPFGTGPRLCRLLSEDPATVAVYPPRVFTALRDLQQLIVSEETADVAALLRPLPVEVAEFLRQADIVRVWPRLQAQHGNSGPALTAAFWCWFDALATVRLANHLSRHCWGTVPLLDAWVALMKLSGITVPAMARQNMTALRQWVRTLPSPQLCGIGV